jgi:hypothetical protein
MTTLPSGHKYCPPRCSAFHRTVHLAVLFICRLCTASTDNVCSLTTEQLNDWTTGQLKLAQSLLYSMFRCFDVSMFRRLDVSIGSMSRCLHVRYVAADVFRRFDDAMVLMQ